MDRRAVVTGLTLARFPFVALGYWAALKGQALSTVTFGLAAIATDIADGRLARRWEVTSDRGSQLDSAADFVFYASLLAWVYLFHPGPVMEHALLFTTFFTLYVVMLISGYFFKRSIAVHNRVSRTAGTVGAGFGLYFIAFAYHEWMLFTLALFATADIAQRLHSIVQALAVKRRGLEG
ncbi:MAG: CDP-alcohol phosphatidyltransferase family protein [Candidatus Thermoplasmatota archaeon]|nr:CDP-alcohol phosphatidyltransferase family protein [Candidatus Thermoplasmatota archaeon]